MSFEFTVLPDERFVEILGRGWTHPGPNKTGYQCATTLAGRRRKHQVNVLLTFTQ